MKPALYENGLDRNPHNIALGSWYYEDTGGLDVYCDVAIPRKSSRVGRISWRQIRAALRRYDAGKTKKGKSK